MSHAQATEADPRQTPGVGLSSTASSAQPTGALIDSNDPAWKHCNCPDVSRRHSLKCNYCQNIYTGGITRIKKHLAKIPKSGVAKCTKVPSDVKNEMFRLLTKKSDAKQKRAKELERDRAEIDLTHSEGEGSDYDGHYAVAVLKAVRGLSTSTSGPVEKFCKPTPGESLASRKVKGVSEKVQSKISTQKRQEERDRVCEYICQFFYEASIPHNAVKLPSFALMLEAIGDYGPNLRGPSPYEISAFLQKKKGVSGIQQLRKRKKCIPNPDDEEPSAHSSSDTEEDSDIDMQLSSASSSSDKSISVEDED
ncbi:hypothetical protein BS78_03G198900 [Paspalum vaginatum]|nr:hypothetical protein BS78_03G198900 [Paspalum vaginatum]